MCSERVITRPTSWETSRSPRSTPPYGRMTRTSRGSPARGSGRGPWLDLNNLFKPKSQEFPAKMGANFPAAARTVRALVLVLVCADLSASVASPSPQTTFPSCTPRAAPLAFATSTSPAFLRGPAALLRRPANRITARCPLRPSLRLPFMCLAGASDDAEDEEIAEVLGPQEFL